MKPLNPRRGIVPRVVVLLAVVGFAAAFVVVLLTTSDSRRLGGDVSSWVRELGKGAVLETEFTIVDVAGLPKDLQGQAASLRWQAPDRLRLETTFKEETIVAGREGNQIWIHLPKKSFAILGDETVPRFTGDEGSVEPVTLPDFALPVSSWEARLLPFLVEVTQRADEDGGGPWQVITPSAIGRSWFDLPEFEMAVREEGEKGMQVRVSQGENKRLHLRVDRFEWRDPSAPDLAWSLPEEAASSADRVALSHLVRAFEVVKTQLAAKTPTLPPATGRREVVATSGRGRLEDHDGVRVLFLEGTPEEMGKQQGELLREEIRSVVDRIVYGVGVGSSFGKGRWFFGEIEEAQSRIEPFIPASHLREMDAIAAAAGLHGQETRLANFFPELFHCSGFALHGSATVDGRIYHGRILDYIRGAGLEDNAVVMVCRPEGANAWVNVSYAGFIGSVTAMNEKQLAIGEMGGRGEGAWDGKPMAQLVREVMESCDTIDEAVALMQKGPRTCEYYYVISDAKSGRAVGIKATPDLFETVWSGESHPQLPDAVTDTVLLSAGDRYAELVKRVKAGFGKFDAESSRELMTRPVCMTSNIQSVLFAPDTLDFWVANADSANVASHTRYTQFNLTELLFDPDKITSIP